MYKVVGHNKDGFQWIQHLLYYFDDAEHFCEYENRQARLTGKVDHAVFTIEKMEDK